ncbi:MAG: ribonuclease R [Alphaproteobacteria bacterium]
MPTREEILAFIADNPGGVGKRGIARAFNIAGSDRGALAETLKELKREGLIGRSERRRLTVAGRLPSVTVAEVVAVDEDGAAKARPLSWRGEGDPPAIEMAPEGRGRRPLAKGDRVLARVQPRADGRYAGRVIRILPAPPGRVLGLYQALPGSGRIVPTDRRIKREFTVAAADSRSAKSGELVVAEVEPGPRLGLPRARVVERLGSMADPRAISLVAIHTSGIPTEFPADALGEAEAARPVTALRRREDLTGLPLVTIDEPDARDFDDAVWAEPDTDPANPGGWKAVVAIADVAHYVRPGSALDRVAYERGNSVYFPDRVVPMLPPALSNGLCCLKPGAVRPCLSVFLWFDRQGGKLRHRFARGLMRSAARLTYDQVQAAADGQADATTEPLSGSVIRPLYEVFRALERARRRRGTLDLDVPERRVVLGEDGQVERIDRRQRLDSHRLIEELMIAANVAAAETLEGLNVPALYRVHDEPPADKLEGLRTLLSSLGLKLGRRRRLSPQDFSRLLSEAEKLPSRELVHASVLRSQARAAYSPANIGHFGLNLARYSHFTSPIRRYPDLLAHRALIKGLGLGPGGLKDGATAASLAAVGEHLSETERRADLAERDTVDRFMAAYLVERVGAVFSARISGVTRFGLFVSLDESGAEGLVPLRSLGQGRIAHDAEGQRLVGRRASWRLGDPVTVRLNEADPLTASLVFELAKDAGEERGRPGEPLT